MGYRGQSIDQINGRQQQLEMKALSHAPKEFGKLFAMCQPNRAIAFSHLIPSRGKQLEL